MNGKQEELRVFLRRRMRSYFDSDQAHIAQGLCDAVIAADDPELMREMIAGLLKDPMSHLFDLQKIVHHI